MSADEMIGQIHTWLDEASPQFEIEALLDLPDVGWVTVEGLADQGLALAKFTYRSRGVSGWLAKHAVELICDRTAVRAIRKIESMDLDIFPGENENEKGAL